MREARTALAFLRRKVAVRPDDGTPTAHIKMSRSDTSCKQAKRCLHLTRSMFVKRFEHKDPRLEARLWSMAAFYNL